MKQPIVLQVLPQLRAGVVERGTLEIAGAIARAGWKPLVASAGGSMVPGVTYVGGEHITLPLTTKNPLRIWSNAALLEDVISRYEVGIVHARARVPAWSAWLAAKRAGIPFMTTFHGVYGLTPGIKKYYNEVMVKGERVIAISQFVEKHLIEHYHVDPQRVRLIHRGVDLSLFDPALVTPQRIAGLVNTWRIPDDLPLILMPSRITRWKGHHVLVEALARLPHRNFFCLLVGDDMGRSSYRLEIEALVSARGLDGHVRIAGNTPFMAEAYTLANIVVAPSIEPEAFGRVPVEAQAMGRMVIAANHGGACETVIHGQTGWLTRPGDAGELSETINHVLHLSKKEKDTIGRQAMDYVRTHFSAEIMCSKTLEVYWELIGHKYE